MTPPELYHRARLSWLELLSLVIKLFIISEPEPRRELTIRERP